MGLDRGARPLRFRMLVAGMLVILVAGCGSSGDGGSSAPTATATVWPTVNDAAEAASPEASPPWQLTTGTPVETNVAPASPAANATPTTVPDSQPSGPTSSPVPATAVDVAGVPGTPATQPETVVATLPAPTSEATLPAAAQVGEQGSPVQQAGNPQSGDGTSGPQMEGIPAGRTASGANGATPMASPGAPVIVTSCDPSSIPSFTGSSSFFITTSDVNIRIGPGTDCDLAGDILSQGTVVTVTSGEVIRDGQQGTTWVRVETNGLVGWVSTEYITPDGT